MKKVKVKLKSSCPLLMNRFAVEDQDDDVRAKRKDEKFDSTEEAKKASYFDQKLGFYIPSSHIEGCLKKAASDFKLKGHKTYKDTILGSVFVEDEKLPLNRQEWDEIDRRAAKVQTARIVRSRPRFNTWELTFAMLFDDERITTDVLRQILSEAGATKGIGDYRPKFGRFKVVEFKEVAEE